MVADKNEIAADAVFLFTFVLKTITKVLVNNKFSLLLDNFYLFLASFS